MYTIVPTYHAGFIPSDLLWNPSPIFPTSHVLHKALGFALCRQCRNRWTADASANSWGAQIAPLDDDWGGPLFYWKPLWIRCEIMWNSALPLAYGREKVDDIT